LKVKSTPVAVVGCDEPSIVKVVAKDMKGGNGGLQILLSSLKLDTS
jgi:hypothetical protein